MLDAKQDKLLPVTTKSTVDHVVESLRHAILVGTYSSSQRLVERQIAEDLEVSTIAIREAFARLAEEGLIRRIPRRGAFVTSLTPESVRDLTRVRIALEQLVVELAMSNWTEETQRELQAIVDEMAHSERDRLFDLDNAFHHAFWRATKSETLLTVAMNLQGRIARYLREAIISVQPEATRDVARVHQEWVDAVAAGDLSRAKAVVHSHIADSCEDVIRRLMRTAREDGHLG